MLETLVIFNYHSTFSGLEMMSGDKGLGRKQY